MTKSLSVIVEIIAIISFTATVINYMIVQPLRESINTLTVAVEKLDTLLAQVNEKEIKLEGRINVLERDTKHCFEAVKALEQYHKKPIK